MSSLAVLPHVVVLRLNGAWAGERLIRAILGESIQLGGDRRYVVANHTVKITSNGQPGTR
jgi:hypothetical protein